MLRQITKSNLRLYLDSPRHFWAKVHGAWEEDVSDFTKKTDEDGYKVEALAMKYLKRYYAIDGRILKEQQTFTDEQFLVRTDGLIYDPATDTYDLYEVKSSTYKEDEPKLDKTDLYDITFQALVLEKNIKVKNYYLVMLNANYRREGELNLKQLFRVINVNQEVDERRIEVMNFQQDMLKIAAMNEYAGLEACFSPKTCGCKEICHPNLPENNIYDIKLRSHEKITKLREAGILDIADIPLDMELSGQSATLIKIYRGAEKLIDKDNIKKILDEYEYPIYFLDYETVSDPIPQFDGTKPFQNLATQYSLHIAHEDGTFSHHEYIYEGKDCPLKYTIEDMLANIGETGTVLAWNESFEKRVNRKAAESYPELADKLLKVNERIKDLGDAFKNLYYMDRAFHCSWSIKKVLPVMCPECSYKELPINHGDQASSEWLRMNSGETPHTEKAKIKENLLRYCELDTWAMVRIWQELNRITAL